MASKAKQRILIVDDAPDTLDVLARNLRMADYQVHTASGVEQAIGLLDRIEVDLVITDYKMPGHSGLDLVSWVAENLPATATMMITGYATIEGAVNAVKLGAEEYLPKPFTDDELLGAVQRVLGNARRRSDHKTSAEAFPGQYGIIGSSKAIRKVFTLINRAAETCATVLISGESGTGKELVARAVHYASRRAAAPFVPVNCAAIPEDLLASELFGYVKGTFTGAATDRPGFFKTADGGSIFLDEISEMSFSMQAKLLRVLQEKEVTMLGARQPEKVDIRVLAATNKNLSQLTNSGLFREDLFWRLNVLRIELPPLRERQEDIPSLLSYFVRRFALEMGREQPQFSPDTLNLLCAYHWPGNVRELENLVQQLLILHRSSVLDLSSLPPYIKAKPGAVVAKQLLSLAEAEKQHIAYVLEQLNGNKSQAARLLGIDRKTLRRKLDE